MFFRLFGLPVTIVRPANAYGLGQKPFTGQGFIATAMGKIISNEEVLIFGEKGTVRDYIHVKDVAFGILHGLDAGRPGEIYNIGSGVGRSNKEVLESISPLAHRDNFELKVKVAEPRAFDVPTNILSYGKLLSETGWQPQVVFSDGILEMWDGMRKMLGK